MKIFSLFTNLEIKRTVFHNGEQANFLDVLERDNTEEIARIEKLLRDYDRLDDEQDSQWIEPDEIAEKREEQRLILGQAGVSTRSELAEKLRALKN